MTELTLAGLKKLTTPALRRLAIDKGLTPCRDLTRADLIDILAERCDLNTGPVQAYPGDTGCAANTEARALEIARGRHGPEAFVRRNTGCLGLSGYFQAYLPCKGSGTWNATSVGDPFHVC
jgi:hypothetical protein